MFGLRKFRLDPPQVPSQRDPASRQDRIEVIAVAEIGDRDDPVVENGGGGEDQSRGQKAAQGPLEETLEQERAPDIPVGGADDFHDENFFPAAEYGDLDRAGNQDYRNQPKQGPRGEP